MSTDGAFDVFRAVIHAVRADGRVEVRIPALIGNSVIIVEAPYGGFSAPAPGDIRMIGVSKDRTIFKWLVSLDSPIYPSWAVFTPTVKQGVTSDIAKTVTYSKYVTVGKMVTWNFVLVVTGSGTAGSAMSLTTPVNAASSSAITSGTGFIYDSDVTTRYGGEWIGNGLSNNVIVFVGDWSGGNAWGTLPNLALASNDRISGSITYEAE